VTGGASALLAVHLAATAAMVGLIWFVQVVHYPLYRMVGQAQFAAYESAHQRLTTWVVGPLMAVEAMCAISLLLFPVDGLGKALPIVGLALLAAIHVSTALLQVPAHRVLSGGYDPDVADRLVATNWLRTCGWSARVAIAIAMVLVALPG